MLGLNQNQRRGGAAAWRHRFAKVPAGVNPLHPRFSPTATFTDAKSTSAHQPDPVPIPLPPVVTAPTQDHPLPTITSPSTTSTSSLTSASSSTSSTTSSTDTTSTPTTTSALTTSVITPPPKTLVTVAFLTSSTSSSASASFSLAPASAAHTGAVVGGVGGAVIGFALIIFAVSFFLRRWRRRDGDNTFDADTFRRSAILMDNPPTYEDADARGFNPRPPSMIERKAAYPVPAVLAANVGKSGGTPGYGGNGYGTMENNYQYASYAPGQTENVASPPPTASSADPLVAAYGQSHPYPMASPISSDPHFDSSHNEFSPTPVLTRQPSFGAKVSRQPSASSKSTYPATNAPISRQPSSHAHPSRDPSQQPNHLTSTSASDPTRQSTHYPANDYIDLARSSVTPFQAAQYVEISRRLNAEVPTGLNTPAMNPFVQGKMESDTESEDPPPLPPKDRASPFADPAPVLPTPQRVSVASQEDDMIPEPSSPASMTHDLDFPAPPATTHVASSRYRIDSTPPMLPEIFIESRGSVSTLSGYDFPSSVRGSFTPSAMSAGMPTIGGGSLFADSPLGDRFPATPSPLASSFGMITPAAGKNRFPRDFHTAITLDSDSEDRSDAGADAGASAPPQLAGESKAPEKSGEKKRPETMYDQDDVYGGI